MKRPAKKTVSKAKAKAKPTKSPVQAAAKVVDSLKKQILAHDKKHAAVVVKVNKAKAKLAAKATAAAKASLAAARKQASASRKIAAALRDDLRSAKVEQKAT
ncbi:hypothetical protein N8456_08925, partial [Porticoccaceae bacterium]|nr:hypothetical protein [Porticoccaceae bacterium]